MSQYKIIGVGNNAKTIKGDGSEYITAIVYLAPSTNLEGFNACPTAKLAGCDKVCLFKAGRGAMSNVIAGRMRKTELYFTNRQEFNRLLTIDLIKFEKYCVKKGIQPVVRLNGTSDLNFINIIKQFPNIKFYDYSKVWNRLDQELPSNYHLTLSYSEVNQDYARTIIESTKKHNVNMAVVFRDVNSIPKTFKGMEVIDGDKDDLRFLDPNDKPYVVALYAKGPAKKDHTGFVIG